VDLDSLVGRTIWDEAVPTPFLYVDRLTLGRNIDRMAEAARVSGVSLRPHTKTHKVAEIARLQLDAGADGLTVAKLGEAQALADAGVSTSFMVAQPYVGGDRVRRQLELAETCEVIACVDSVDLAGAMAGEAAARGRELDFALIVDTGYGRLGVPPGEAAARAEAIAGLEGARFRGIRSHSGAAYEATGTQERRGIAAEDASTMAGIAVEIRSKGLPCELVSVGSTPGLAGLADAAMFEGVTEWRPGNYVFFDCMQVSIGSAALEDCALTVVASVVSTPGPGRAIIDAGVKTLSHGQGLVLDRPGVSLVRLSEESGWIESGEAQLRVGERLRVVPNHACELPNLAEVVFYGEGEEIEGVWRPVARGKVW
jgi:D-serine deaminase-like pyridoxal phosphate-dependent protein